jgi:hypothetical protein
MGPCFLYSVNGNMFLGCDDYGKQELILCSTRTYSCKQLTRAKSG